MMVTWTRFICLASGNLCHTCLNVTCKHGWQLSLANTICRRLYVSPFLVFFHYNLLKSGQGEVRRRQRRRSSSESITVTSSHFSHLELDHHQAVSLVKNGELQSVILIFKRYLFLFYKKFVDTLAKFVYAPLDQTLISCCPLCNFKPLLLNTNATTVQYIPWAMHMEGIIVESPRYLPYGDIILHTFIG
jgi:hypothetical protein